MNNNFSEKDIKPTARPVNMLIIDDEKEACINLQNILNEYIDGDITIAGIAHTTDEAGKLIEKYHPDAIFLDIDMPGENGLEFLNRIHPFSFDVIFITAYDNYAIKAFKLNAVDYLLKPIDIKELQYAVDKLNDRLMQKRMVLDDYSLYKKLISEIYNKEPADQITIKDKNSIEVIRFENILFIEAKGSYSKITYLSDNVEKYIMASVSLAEYEELLPESIFFRVHKSFIINYTYANKITKEEQPTLLINNLYNIPVSRRKMPALLSFMKSHNHKRV